MPDEGSYLDDMREALASTKAEPAPAPEPDPNVELEQQTTDLELLRQAEKPAEPDEPAEDEDASVGDIIRAKRIEGQVPAPEHWPAEDKELFNSLPSDDVRNRVLGWRTSVEKGAQEKFTAAAAARKDIEEIDAALAPVAQDLQASGISRGEAVQRLMAAEQALRQDPEAGFISLMGGYGRSIAGTEQARSFLQKIATALSVDLGAHIGQARLDPTAARMQELEYKLRGARTR